VFEEYAAHPPRHVGLRPVAACVGPGLRLREAHQVPGVAVVIHRAPQDSRLGLLIIPQVGTGLHVKQLDTSGLDERGGILLGLLEEFVDVVICQNNSG